MSTRDKNRPAAIGSRHVKLKRRVHTATRTRRGLLTYKGGSKRWTFSETVDNRVFTVCIIRCVPYFAELILGRHFTYRKRIPVLQYQFIKVRLRYINVPWTLLLNIVQGSVYSAAYSHTEGFRVGGGVHDSYTFQCGLVGSFTSPGPTAFSVSSERHWQRRVLYNTNFSCGVNFRYFREF